jgi:hypothetical protein
MKRIRERRLYSDFVRDMVIFSVCIYIQYSIRVYLNGNRAGMSLSCFVTFVVYRIDSG